MKLYSDCICWRQINSKKNSRDTLQFIKKMQNPWYVQNFIIINNNSSEFQNNWCHTLKLLEKILLLAIQTLNPLEPKIVYKKQHAIHSDSSRIVLHKVKSNTKTCKFHINPCCIQSFPTNGTLDKHTTSQPTYEELTPFTGSHCSGHSQLSTTTSNRPPWNWSTCLQAPGRQPRTCPRDFPQLRDVLGMWPQVKAPAFLPHHAGSRGWFPTPRARNRRRQ